MDRSTGPMMPLLGAARRLFHRVLSVGENRFQLFVVELQEERDRLVDMVVLAIAIAAVGMLCGIAWSAALVMAFWRFGFDAVLVVLVVLGAVYGLIAFALWRKLVARRGHQSTLAATINQLQKDRECFEKS